MHKIDNRCICCYLCYCHIYMARQILLYSRAMTIKFHCIRFLKLTKDYSWRQQFLSNSFQTWKVCDALHLSSAPKLGFSCWAAALHFLFQRPRLTASVGMFFPFTIDAPASNSMYSPCAAAPQSIFFLSRLVLRMAALTVIQKRERKKKNQ